MKQIRLAYGKTGLMVGLEENWNTQVVEPLYQPASADPDGALITALRSPMGSTALRERACPGSRVGIIVNDITRATPSQRILTAVLAELSDLEGIQVTLFNALGTHRPNTDSELRGMLGDALVDQYRIVQNDCRDRATQTLVGISSRGNEIWLNRELADCDLVILTGFIEPHFFAGFSGGGKAVMPGMAGLATILGNHSAQNIADPRATWGITEGNPIWEEVMQAAGLLGETFLVNVTLNRDKQITAVFAGDLVQAHAAGCAAARATAMVGVDEPFDIVLTSNSGYPLDLNLYQTVKGMSAAAQIVRPGGAIIAAAECWDGIPEHGQFAALLREASSPQDLLTTVLAPGVSRQDQWQGQVLAQILVKAEVYLYSSHLSPDQVQAAMLRPVEAIEAALAMLMQRYGPGARLCVLPDGPLTIPYVRG